MKEIQLCPVCKSKEIQFAKWMHLNEATMVDLYECKRCGNLFSSPLIVDAKEAKKIKETKLTKKILHNTPKETYYSYGALELNIYWKILGTILVIVGIFVLLASTMPMHCFFENAIGANLCYPNEKPVQEMLTGIISSFSGLFLLLESSRNFRSMTKKSRLMKIGIIIALTGATTMLTYLTIFVYP